MKSVAARNQRRYARQKKCLIQRWAHQTAKNGAATVNTIASDASLTARVA